MKCKNCGSNLDIDKEVCPYCGAENKIAKKHREDMKRYAMDYEITKDTVVRKSRKLNDRSIRIAVLAVTVAAIALLVLYSSSYNSQKRDSERKRYKKELAECLPQAEKYIENQDFMALGDLIKCQRLFDSTVYKGEYSDIFRATGYYQDLFSSVMVLLGDSGYRTERLIGSIGDDIVHLEQYVGKISTDRCNEYLLQMREEAILLLERYLGMSRQEYENLLKMTATERNVAIGEVVHALQEEK